MTRELLVAVPDYWQTANKPQNFTDFCARFSAQDFGPGPLGLWCIREEDACTGRVKRELWAKNVITDNGGLGMLKNNWNSTGSAVAVNNILAIGNQSAATTLTSALVSGTNYTTLSVAAVNASIPSGTTLTIGYGTGQTQNVTTNGVTAALATSITVISFAANAAYATLQNVVVVPTTSDNPPTIGPASVTGVQYSTPLLSGAFAFSGTGAGNRQVTITFQFLGASYTAGSYTEVFTCNANPIVSGSVASHLIRSAMALDAVTNVTVVVIEKI